MPYTVTPDRHGGREQTATFAISGTAVAAATEATLPIDWPVCEITHVQATLTSLGVGTAVTINPGVGKASAWSTGTQDEAWLATATAAHVNEKPAKNVSGAQGFLYFNANVDAGVDGTVEALVTVRKGHDG